MVATGEVCQGGQSGQARQGGGEECSEGGQGGYDVRSYISFHFCCVSLTISPSPQFWAYISTCSSGCGNACFGAQVSSKYGTWYSEQVFFTLMCVGSLAGVTYRSLHSADEAQEGRNSCPLLRYCFIGSCHVGVSKRFSRSISLAVYCLYRCWPYSVWHPDRRSFLVHSPTLNHYLCWMFMVVDTLCYVCYYFWTSFGGYLAFCKHKHKIAKLWASVEICTRLRYNSFKFLCHNFVL